MSYAQFIKKLRLSSFRSKAILSFLALLASLIVWVASYFYIHRKDAISENLSIEILDVSKQFNANIDNYNTFFYTGYRDAAFYNKSEASSLYTYLANLRSIPDQLEIIEQDALEIQIPIDIQKVKNQYKNLRRDVITLVAKMERRGYKDFGIEGEMQEKAQVLTESDDIDKATILQLRTLEKDYLIRGESKYIQEFETIANELLADRTLSDSSRILVRGYTQDLQSLVNLNNEIGNYSETGLHKNIKELHQSIQKELSEISLRTNKAIESKKTTQITATSIISILIAFILVLLVLYLSKNLTKGVQTLNENMLQFIESDFEDTQEIQSDHSILEIKSLFSSYQKLKETLVQNIDELEITAKKATDNAHYKTQFLSKMSHEMRTPLNGIQGMLHLLKSGDESPKKQEEYISIIDRSVHQLSDLITMVLDHSKLETGNLEIQEKSVNLERDISQLMRIFEYQAKEKNLDFEYHNHSDTSYTVFADSLRLQQVLIHLMKNAIKFTQQGKITIIIDEYESSLEYQQLRFSVGDTGIGMDEDDFDKLLESFEQGDNSKTRKFDGAGLGMSLSNDLLKLMNSKLEVRSTLGKGTVFYFDVSLKKGEHKSREDVSKKIKVALLNNPKKTHVLVVEDNKINQKVIERLLSKLHITCDIATNGKEGVALFKKNTYDLILMDINMPIMGGIEAAKKIKSLKKYATQTTPIIAITAAETAYDENLASENSLDELLGKPIDFETLKEIIKRYLNISDSKDS
ncbi:ATP-binding protein [Dokdonia ponticola]|uniref:histidine kinase n=1 Tax=Dokdonia ponticola TaxID=2041041 RepID=A0ABV9I3G3_9FLAO